MNRMNLNVTTHVVQEINDQRTKKERQYFDLRNFQNPQIHSFSFMLTAPRPVQNASQVSPEVVDIIWSQVLFLSTINIGSFQASFAS